MATDIQHIGSIALLSELQAADATGHPADAVGLPNPVEHFSERRTIRSLYGAGRERRQRVVGVLATAKAALEELPAELGSGHVDSSPVGWGEQLLRNPSGNSNRDMLLESADLPPFLLARKEEDAKEAGVAPMEDSWDRWLAGATSEQLTNFSQWYTERLRTLADPESKGRLIEDLKHDYKHRVHAAVIDGWIDPALEKAMGHRVDSVTVRFFSPFGRMTEHAAGAVLKPDARYDVLLPTVAGEYVATHEFGHVFAGIETDKMAGYYESRLGDLSEGRALAVGDLYEVLNEGFNEHMTAALLNGSPEIISPSGRAERGLAELPGASSLYQRYREAFAVLMGGEEGRVATDDLNEVVKVMAKRDFVGFAQQLQKKWPHQDVMGHLVNIAQEHRRSSGGQVDDRLDMPLDRLADRIIAELRPVNAAPVEQTSVELRPRTPLRA